MSHTHIVHTSFRLCFIVNFNFLLRAYAQDPKSETSEKILSMVTHTMNKMAAGGINDHINKVCLSCVDSVLEFGKFEK